MPDGGLVVRVGLEGSTRQPVVSDAVTPRETAGNLIQVTLAVLCTGGRTTINQLIPKPAPAVLRRTKHAEIGVRLGVRRVARNGELEALPAAPAAAC